MRTMAHDTIVNSNRQEAEDAAVWAAYQQGKALRLDQLSQSIPPLPPAFALVPRDRRRPFPASARSAAWLARHRSPGRGWTSPE